MGRPATITVLLLLLLGVLREASGAPNTRLVSVLCNAATYTRGDPFAVSLAYVLADLQAATPAYKGRDYYDISPFPNALAYGHAACGAKGTAGDCAVCLRAATEQVNSSCAMSIGARCVLADCTIRYEQYPFVN